jgi:hypothetical protein
LRLLWFNPHHGFLLSQASIIISRSLLSQIPLPPASSVSAGFAAFVFVSYHKRLQHDDQFVLAPSSRYDKRFIIRLRFYRFFIPPTTRCALPSYPAHATTSITTCLFAFFFFFLSSAPASSSCRADVSQRICCFEHVVATPGYMHRQHLRAIRRTRLETVPTHERQSRSFVSETFYNANELLLLKPAKLPVQGRQPSPLSIALSANDQPYDQGRRATKRWTPAQLCGEWNWQYSAFVTRQVYP